MRGNMNSGFINRNRIYRMNRNGMMNEETLINNDLYCLPDELIIADEIDFDIDRSIRPYAIGVMSYKEDEIRHYFAYENDIRGDNVWLEEFDTFRHAVKFAQTVFEFRTSERNIVYKYDEDTRILRK